MLMLLGHLSMRFLLRTGSHCLSRKTTRGGYPSPPFLERIGNPVPPKSCVINIEQLDGNMSLSFLDMSLVESESECITVHTGYRPPKTVSPRLPSTLKTVRRDNKVLQGVSLPKLSVYNMRSLLPKVESLGTDMLNRSCSLSFLTEVWTKSENKKHLYKIEELFELRGIEYVSTPRPGNRRGGGAAILINTEKFSISKLNIENPASLEVVWGLLRPSEISGKISKIIVCCFYCPPRSKRKRALIEHLTLTIQTLLTLHQNAGIIIAGDRNDLGMDKLLSVDSSLHQVVNSGTRGQRVLNVILTNLDTFYEEPEIVPAIPVDNPSKRGVPSDHCGVVMAPRTCAGRQSVRSKICKTVRPISASAICNIGQVLVDEEWTFMSPSMSPTDLTGGFEYYMINPGFLKS